MVITRYLLTVFSVFATTTLGWAAVPPNAFIERPATSRSELLAQIDKNPVVRDRYQRHFAMSGPELRSYMAAMSPGKLRSAGLFTVYNVPKNGVLRSKVLRLDKGTKVWVDLAGVPTLMMICGNPLTLGPIRASDSPDVIASSHGFEVDSTRQFAAEPGEPVADLIEPLVLITNLEPGSPEVSCEAPPVVATLPESGPIVFTSEPQLPVLGILAGVPAVPWFLTPAIAGAVIVFPAIEIGDDQAPVVPEPATVVALMMGAAGLAARRLRR